MVAFTSTFPLEVIELIIDNLAINENESLPSVKMCSLVSRRLLPRTRKYIFGSILINSFHRVACPTSQMFACLISQTPEISKYVTSLSYVVKEEDLAVASFATALQSLTSLKSLAIRPYFRNKWKDLPLRGAILNLMHMPTLKHLTLSSCDGFYLSDLTLCVGLESLKMRGFGSVEMGEDIELYQEQSSHLDSYVGASHDYPSGGLLMQLCTARRSDGKPVIDISSLKKVSLEVADDELDAIQEWFKTCTQLKEVHLSRSDRLLKYIRFADLFLPSLRTLQHIYLEFYVLQEEDPFLPLVTGFASLAGKNVIESIEISIFVWLCVDCTYGNEWGALDEVFAQGSGWQKLRSFTVDIEVGYPLDGTPADVDELVQNLRELPDTQLRGLANSEDIVLYFDVSTVQTY